MKKDTFEFLTEAFWPLNCTRSSPVLKIGKEKRQYPTSAFKSTSSIIIDQTLLSRISASVSGIHKASSNNGSRQTFKAFWDWEGSITTGAGHRVAAPVGFVQAIERNLFSVENSVGLQICDPDLLGIVKDAASFDAHRAGSWKRKRREGRMSHAFTRCWTSAPRCQQHRREGNGAPPPTPADGLGGPLSRALAPCLGVALEDVVLGAAVFNLLLVAVRSHHGEGDEAVGDPRRDGAAHLWPNKSRWRFIYQRLSERLMKARTPARGRLRRSSVSQTGASLMARRLWRVAFIRPAVSILDRRSRNGFVVDYFPTHGWFRQGAGHSCRSRNTPQVGKFPLLSSQTKDQDTDRPAT